MRLTVLVLITCVATAALGQQTPSVKEDFKNAGRSAERGVEGTYDKAKDATVNGVGKAMEETGEGLDKAGKKMEGAAERVEEKAK